MQYIESIYLSQGGIRNYSYHRQRVIETIKKDLLPTEKELLTAFHHHISNEEIENNCFKTRILYDRERVQDISFSSYNKRSIEQLLLVNVAKDFNYEYKYADREHLDSLKKNLPSNSEIILVKDNAITDTSYSNLCFLQDGFWYTPKSYLLNGTMRQACLEHNNITEREITVEDLFQYTHVSIINAMLLPGELAMPINIIRSNLP